MGWIIFGAIVGLIINIIFCIRFASCAEERGYSAGVHFWICFFFGMFGYLWVAGLPDRAMQYRVSELEAQIKKLNRFGESTTDEEEKWICGFCGASNKQNYGQCKKCGKNRGQ